MVIVRVAYFSRNRLDFFNAPMRDRVSELRATSVAHNRRDGITGALVYDEKWFAQILEGGERVVSNAFERILRDQRHSDVTLVALSPVVERYFGDCPMTCAALGKSNSDLVRHCCDSARFDPPLMSADRLMQLIEAVVGRSADGTTSCASSGVTNAA
jgi:hypothetical protein